MGDKHVVRFEPVDLEMEVDEEETVLNAAFRQGIALMHGCKEGQCAACKSFLLDGDVQMDRYSTFALAEYESDEGYILLCKSHAYSDLTVELINYDEEELRNAVPLQHLRTRIAAIEPVTHDIVSLRLDLVEPAAFTFKPGQYADIRIPGQDGHRSFSMANLPGEPLEFLIKKYPGGHFSGLLDDTLKPGDELELDGPYGTFTLKKSSDRRIVCIGGGAGLAPILSLLRHLVADGIDRPVRFFYGARNHADLFYLEQIEELGAKLTDFEFVGCLSDSWPDGWANTGFVTEVVQRLEPGLAECDAYLCGPPPMVDAAIALLEMTGVPPEHIHYDKFTTSVAE
ncbi:FAD-binding oxidoreductase [Kribbella sp. VKM Ac-2568]|uniref:FAD-binding oxidoreductase n=1 Tax=Kribbella sp. VKM Ac-2568 TaxID=2512219 RepID=UPI001045B3FC|nr:FAD-binding oxidoreductase [Kribbella sp. VKM Ac-2568]TCM41190.1 propane monooxygenase reductase subunit [Kribbella sp. VKM Ac-2568]